LGIACSVTTSGSLLSPRGENDRQAQDDTEIDISLQTEHTAPIGKQ
jgi:hypothetical protein